MKRESGFTLIELMIVVAIILVIAAIAIPSLLNARKSGNEASAISSLRTLSTVNQQYRTRFQSYAGNLADLSAASHVDDVLGSGTKSGYIFTYTGTADSFNVSAVPALVGTDGNRGFFADESGVIRFDPTGAAATSASSSID
jgi:prepilin-type N-terminal cleavage/methylation domain-containing protein